MNTEDITKTCDILRASADLLLRLRQLAEEQEKALNRSDPETMEYLSALHLNWLLEKYRIFWFPSVETEIYINQACPDIELFSPLDFELSLKHLLHLIDGDRYSLTKSSHDQGIDLIHERKLDPNLNAYSTIIVQCKLYRGFVPVSEIRDFFGVMAAHIATGLFATTGTLTSQGKQFIPTANSSPHTNRLFVITSGGIKRLFNVGRQLTDLILHSDVSFQNSIEFSAWSDKLDALKTTGHQLLWPVWHTPYQERLF